MKYEATLIDHDGYYQVSDDIESEIIKECTKNCQQDNCCLSARVGMTTLAGTSSYYDKNGGKHISDSNNKTVEVTCRMCWNTWKVQTKRK